MVVVVGVVTVVVVLVGVVTVVVVLVGVVTVVAARFDPVPRYRPTVLVAPRWLIANAERPTPAPCETPAGPPDPAARASAGASVPVITPAEASAAIRRRLVNVIREAVRRRSSDLASARVRGVTSRSQGAGRSVPTRRLR